MHKWNNAQFVALKIDASGVTTTSITSSIGSIHNCGTYSSTHDAMGQLTISKDGLKVVNALTCQDKFELFDFNINTGVLSNFISIPGNGGSAWGTGFSPDSKKLYVNSIFGSQVFQYNLSTYSASAIIASKISLYNTGSSGYNFGYMELGPDKKMYIPRPNTSYFSIVNSPNNLGALSGFSFNGINLAPYTSSWGISRIAYNIGTASGSLSVLSSHTNVLCFGDKTASGTITPLGSGSYNYLWVPGNYTTATVSNLSAGIYTVSVNDGACNMSTTDITITQPSQITSNLVASSYTICKAGSAYLIANYSGGTPNYTINWNTGATTNSITVSPHVTEIYNYTVTDANSCVKTQTIQINVLQINDQINENLPNVFTPNEDGINDRFDFRVIENCNVFSFEIFNRWGLLLMSSSETHQTFWDGRTTSGEPVTDGTYFYIMNITNGVKLKGTVTVFR